MKVRFFVDVPEYLQQNLVLFATTVLMQNPPGAGWKRVSFEVNLPDDTLKTADAVLTQSDTDAPPATSSPT